MRAPEFLGAEAGPTKLATVTDSSRTSMPPLLAAALISFGLGLLAIVVMFLVLLLSDTPPGLWLYLSAMLCPFGFLLGLVHALRSGRRVRR